MKATHNSLSYASPKNPLYRLASFLWRCQDKTIISQINLGVKAFDIRVVFATDKLIPRSAHGIVTLDIDPVEALRLIDTYAPNSYVRLILEHGSELHRKAFVYFCRSAAQHFSHIRFIGGNYKPTWKQLHDFGTPDESAILSTLSQHVGSMQSWWGKLCPWLWARRHRHDIPAQADSNDLPIIMLDFV